MVDLEDKAMVFESLLNVMTCVICGEYGRPKFRQCQSGHIVCQYCIGSRFCPDCLPIVNCRVYVLDRIHNVMTFPCRFRLNNCPFKGKYPDVQVHQRRCKQSLVFCPIVNCDWRDEPRNIFEHVQSVHVNNNNVQVSPERIRVKRDCEIRYIFKKMGHYFLVVFSIVRNQHTYAQWDKTFYAYATNFDYTQTNIENFDVLYEVPLRNGETFQGTIPCQLRHHTEFKWHQFTPSDLMNQNMDFVFTVRSRVGINGNGNEN